ncbi:hypothetical protein O181_122715 [Austropuccinia psidii MF-1]|uniref:Uncharacterized protein n=1 Tax=Austropuccinia psidii MF-1 TaxID=1389203 RepID=A0A9Q3KPS4_9BASI|nr:hypothetical protein [Austropuccinia psidii MF-1]
MEDSRTSTSSHRLATPFDILFESPEAEITAIPVFRPESFPTGNGQDISVSVQELVYGCKAAGVVKKPKHFVRGPEERVFPKEGQNPSGSSQASTSKNLPQKVPNKGKQKSKGKAKPKGNRPYQQNYKTPQKEKISLDNVFNISRTLMEVKNKEEERMRSPFQRNRLCKACISC